MRAPPPLTVDIPPSRGWQAVQAGLWALAGAALAAWAAGHAGVFGGPGAWGAVALGTGLVGTLGWRLARAEPVRLSWTGERWVAACPPDAPFEPVRPVVTFDLGGGLLLRLEGEAKAVRWVAATRSRLVGDWAALRATLLYGVRDSAPPAVP